MLLGTRFFPSCILRPSSSRGAFPRNASRRDAMALGYGNTTDLMTSPSPNPPVDTDDLIALLFLQTRQDEFRLVEPCSAAHVLGARRLSPQVSAGRYRLSPARVSGTSAREEGLRILTSPRREASLFKLGRNPRVPAILLFGSISLEARTGALPLDRRRPWRKGLGHRQRTTWRDLPLHPAAGATERMTPVPLSGLRYSAASPWSMIVTRTASSGSSAIGDTHSSPLRFGPTTPPSKNEPS